MLFYVCTFYDSVLSGDKSNVRDSASDGNGVSDQDQCASSNSASSTDPDMLTDFYSHDVYEPLLPRECMV